MPLNSRNPREPETARYASWVQLSNHVLEKLREPRFANRFTDFGLPQLKDVDGSTLIFQRNHNKQATAESSGLSMRRVAKGTSQCPGVIALPIAAAVKMTENPPSESDKSWETTWKSCCSNIALTTPLRASERSDILLNVEVRKQKGYEMKFIPLRHDEKLEVSDIGPYSLDSSSTDDSELEDGTSDNEDDTDDSEDAITGSKDEDDTSDNEDDIRDDEDATIDDEGAASYDEDATSDDEDATSENELGLESSTNQNKKRSRKPDDSSSGRSKKKRRGNNGKVVSSGSGDDNYGSRSRPPKTVSRPPPPEQMAIYAAERLSSSVAVRHSIDFLVIGERPRT